MFADELAKHILGLAAQGTGLEVHIVVQSQGGVGRTAAVAINKIEVGFDWDRGRLLIYPESALSQLSSADVAAIRESVRNGSSWHAYQRFSKQEDRIKALEAELADARAAQKITPAAPALQQHHCTARSADGACEECEGHARALAAWKQEQEALLLNQAVEMLMEHSEEQRRRGNDSQANGAAASAIAVQRTAMDMGAAYILGLRAGLAQSASNAGHREEASDYDIRALWKSAGGEFHGPVVETGTMPEGKLIPFLRLLSGGQPPVTPAGEPFPIQVGGKYIRRDGVRVVAVEAMPDLRDAGLVAMVEQGSPQDWQCVSTANGRVNDSEQSPFDVVAAISVPVAPTETAP